MALVGDGPGSHTLLEGLEALDPWETKEKELRWYPPLPEASYLVNLGQDLGEVLLSGQPLQGGQKGSEQVSAPHCQPQDLQASGTWPHPFPQFDS